MGTLIPPPPPPLPLPSFSVQLHREGAVDMLMEVMRDVVKDLSGLTLAVVECLAVITNEEPEHALEVGKHGAVDLMIACGRAVLLRAAKASRQDAPSRQRVHSGNQQAQFTFGLNGGGSFSGWAPPATSTNGPVSPVDRNGRPSFASIGSVGSRYA